MNENDEFPELWKLGVGAKRCSCVVSRESRPQGGPGIQILPVINGVMGNWGGYSPYKWS